jgi:VWFA-related protein
MRSRRWLTAALAALLLLAPGTVPSRAEDAALARLTPEQKRWLEEAALLIGKQERKTFLALAKDYQRDAFIRRFWEARDPYPDTQRNEFKDRWYALIEEARKEYGNITEDRARMLLLHGPADGVRKTDCGMLLWPIEIWTYQRTERLPQGFVLIFVQKAAGGPYRLWRPTDGIHDLLAIYGPNPAEPAGSSLDALYSLLARFCPAENLDVIRAVRILDAEERLGALDLTELAPPTRDSEWLDTFLAVSTDLPDAAPALTAHLEIGFPERHESRTVVQGVLSVPVAAPAGGEAAVAASGGYHFLLTAEVLRGEDLFESFRYRFDVPAAEAARGTASLVFERYLRPGSYKLIYKLEDLQTASAFREERPLEVPEVEAAPTPDAAVTAALDAAQGEIHEGGPALELVLPAADSYTGALRVDTRVHGEEIHKVEFLLDGHSLLKKNRPPFSVEVNLGALPRTRTLAAVGYDDQGREVARDERTLNAGSQRFSAHLVEPRPGATYRDHLTAEAQVQVPDGQKLERVEFYLGDDRVATLYQPPFVQPMTLSGSGETQFVRVVAYLADGTSTETLTLINAPDYGENIKVSLVELYAAVLDGAGRLVPDLGRDDFHVFDDGAEQRIVRFERVTDLPVHTVLLIDTSASMAESLPQAQRAALDFLRQTLTPRDRAALVTFSDQPQLAVKFTNDLPALAGGLGGLTAERGTVLYDSVVFALQYLKGVRGQRALLILSDGADRGSRFSFDETLEFARRSGVTVFTVGLGVGKLNLEARPKLKKLAAETGGQSYFIDKAEELAGVYAQIQEQLRSRYLLVYQPSEVGKEGEFRTVDVKTSHPGLEVQTIRGYYP